MRTGLARVSLTVLAIVLVVSFAFASNSHIARAQDATPEMMAHITCDADLILSLYTAEYHFDFAAVHDKMMTDHPDMQMAALTSYDEGQFAPLFTSMMAMMDSSMSMGMLDETVMTNVANAMAMDDAALHTAMMEMAPAGADAAMMTELTPAAVAGEPAECTALRDELRHFYTALAYANMMPAASK